jgi:UDP-glucose 6-dehydrogenase
MHPRRTLAIIRWRWAAPARACSRRGRVLTDVTYRDGPYDCIWEADAAVIVTKWEQFRALDFDLLKDLMACPVIVAC